VEDEVVEEAEEAEYDVVDEEVEDQQI